ncbi:unnamed protein product [Litomosoides sigmodontis]|uniref:Uncharacterized protein n=1 Tax=Litomosoides sigmodontis TaxID=42156 RepID=A0A3P6TJ82_LITSI|nr:unnamed protein product [Litomosoides sigmodontis]
MQQSRAEQSCRIYSTFSETGCRAQFPGDLEELHLKVDDSRLSRTNSHFFERRRTMSANRLMLFLCFCRVVVVVVQCTDFTKDNGGGGAKGRSERDGRIGSVVGKAREMKSGDRYEYGDRNISCALNESSGGDASRKLWNDAKYEIGTDERNWHISRNYKAQRGKDENGNESAIAVKVPTATSLNAQEISLPATWSNGIWSWMIHLIALILLLILILSCAIWYCGSSSRRPNYITI